MYLPPCSPDLNPIEEFLAELKAFIKKQWPSMKTTHIKTLSCSLNGVSVV
jgi:transposase